ncbi:2-oxo-4-hydroxy-4-carboxy-5-ureidoimidazoline decarboxylase [Pseudomonas oryzihabitans]|uniref:2-oxo-4-hydroxy-4-carboxy-5-ureidoimidazoline decarboxylase n=2 Tax=Pseudomonas oryzihabitans TaxID=47885 RepID=UPI002B1E297E|nr:2-oxo-4-hydroxy-4-carboxy-5-ureidoimidazoline decarboxylase [Pseudomonas oryzihabitans]
MSAFQTVTPSQLDRAAFVAAFGGVYEHSAWVAERAFDEGTPLPDTIEALHQRLAAQVAQASQAEQLALIQAHPDLAGRAALAGELTAASSGEQAGAGLDQCSPDELTRFTHYNEAYRAKFSFPFIMAVKGSNRHLILAAFEERLPNTPEQEFQRALAEIDRIALFRLQTL